MASAGTDSALSLRSGARSQGGGEGGPGTTYPVGADCVRDRRPAR